MSYKWQKSVGPVVDMQVNHCSHELTKCSHDHILPSQGSSTAILELNHLQIGDYVFTLTVTDISDQQSTAEVSVAVVEGNRPLSLVCIIITSCAHVTVAVTPRGQ